MSTFDEVHPRLISQNEEIQKRALQIVDDLIADEHERGKSSESRVNIILALSGVGATILFPLGKTVINSDLSNFGVLVYSLYLTTIILLLKSVHNALKSITVSKINRLTPDLAVEIQDKNLVEALKYETAWKIWFYKKLIPFYTKKLFFLHRSQRNLSTGIFALLLLGPSMVLNTKVAIPTDAACIIQCCEYLIAVGALSFCVFLDKVAEKYGFWYFE